MAPGRQSPVRHGRSTVDRYADHACLSRATCTSSSCKTVVGLLRAPNGLRFIPVRVAALLAIALTLSACSGSSKPGVLINADIPSYLNLQMNASALVTVEGGPGLNRALSSGLHQTCSSWHPTAFIPSGKSGESLGGEGDPLHYPEVLALTFRCSSPSAALALFQVSSRGRRSVTGVGDRAAIFDAGKDDSQSYPRSRVYIIDWVQGRFAGIDALAGRGSDERITPALVELLAHRAAGET